MKAVARLLASLTLMGLFVASAQGNLVVSTSAEPPVLDPSASTSQEIARMLYDNVLQGLVKLDRTGAIVPALAESWSISDEGTTYTFTLRQGVTFHDGRPFGPADVVAKFERARDPESGHVNTSYYEGITSIVAIDANTIEFHLADANSLFLFDLARPESVIGPEGYVDEQSTRPIGTGPFAFVAWNRGESLVLEKFADYYDKALPYLDGVTFRFQSDPQSQLAALRSGDIDVIGYGLSPENAILARDLPGIKVLDGAATNEVVLSMNNATEPFNNLLVRRAMQYAVDKEELVQGVMFGFGAPIGSHRTSIESCYVDLTGLYPPSQTEARRLLAEAGYTEQNPLRFVFTIPAGYDYARRLGEAVASQLTRVGVEVKIETVEWSTWLSRVFRGHDFQMSIIGHSQPNDINRYGEESWYINYDRREEFASLYERYLRTPDEEQACEIMATLQTMLAEDAVAVYLMELPYVAAMKERVEGWWSDQPTPSLNVTEVQWAQ